VADLQCLICDFTVEPEEGDDEVLTLLGTHSPEAGQKLLWHMKEHSLTDWVKAFKMADAYIEQLETEIEDLKATPQYAPARIQAPAPPVFQNGGGSPEWTAAEMGRMSRQDQIRRLVEEHDSEQTLIPRIPDAVRPEGVVGVKY
jgi:hypothetical protein